MSRSHTSRVLSALDPEHRIAELETECAVLRRQRDRLLAALTANEAAEGFALELLARGIRTPDATKLDRRGRRTD